jgi:hypothetical protein
MDGCSSYCSQQGFPIFTARWKGVLMRSQDDRYAGQVEEMDPLFAAWGKADMI